MKKIIIIVCALTSLFTGLLCDDAKFNYSDINAEVRDAGSVRYSIFTPMTVAVSDNIEISAHPIMLFLSPSIELKYCFADRKINADNIAVASYHGINYPTILMSLVAMKGTGGIISPEFDIPHMFAIRNGLMFTKKLQEFGYLSGRFGIEFALNTRSLDAGTSVDLPMIASRSAIYYNNVGFDIALSNEGSISKKFDYAIKVESFVYPFVSDRVKREYTDGSMSFFFEFGGSILWNITETAKLAPGFKLTYGDYPFGGQWHLLPSIDFIKWIE
jgi:hypothetical protein